MNSPKNKKKKDNDYFSSLQVSINESIALIFFRLKRRTNVKCMWAIVILTPYSTLLLVQKLKLVFIMKHLS